QPALGLFENAKYQSSEITLFPNDLVMLYTDGLYEVSGPGGELYTQELLAARVQQRLTMPASQLFDEVLKEILRFSDDKGFTDDVCIVGMEWTGATTK